MTYRGKVQNGVIVLDEPATLPEGTVVRVDPLEQPGDNGKPATASSQGEGTIWDKLVELAGSAEGLPTDLAERHDHYKRERLRP